MRKSLLLIVLFLTFASAVKSDWVADACGLPYDSKFPCILVRDSMWYSATDFGIFYSVEESQHWTNGTPNFTDRVFNCLTFFGNFILGGTEGGNIFMSPLVSPPRFTTSTNNLPEGTSVYSLVSSGNNIFAGLKDRVVYFSQDTGKTWTNRSSGIPTAFFGKIYLFVNGTSLYAATDGAGIFVSHNNGINWQAINSGLTNPDVRAICFYNSNIFAGTLGSGIFVSSDNGQSWTQKNTGLGNLKVNALTVLNNRVVAGTDSGVYVSANSGNSWYSRNTGWDSPRVLSFATANLLHAGTESEMTWAIAIDEIVSVKKTDSRIPDKYVLYQNYPNPFNPATNIKFNIKNNSFVTLKVYDLLGKEITTLVNENLQAGIYEVPFSGSQISSGIYLYKIEVNSSKEKFTDIKRMVLIK